MRYLCTVVCLISATLCVAKKDYWAGLTQSVNWWVKHSELKYMTAFMNDWNTGKPDGAKTQLHNACRTDECHGEVNAAWTADKVRVANIVAHALGQDIVKSDDNSTTLALTRVAQGPSQADVDEAYKGVRWAWNNKGPCTRVILCATYFDSFGVNINFADGSIAPFAHIQRLTTSAHDCIQHAIEYLNKGDRGMAIQWAMASQIHNKKYMNWMHTHPDAVVVALQKIK